MHQYAEVLIDLVTDAADRPFHYLIPPDLAGKVAPGSLVRVPFGRSQYSGYVLRLLEQPAVSRVRPLAGLLSEEPLLGRETLALLHWLAHRGYCRRIEALHAILPSGLRQGRLPAGRRLLTATVETEIDLSAAPAQQRALALLREKGPLTRSELAAQAGVSLSTIRSLEEKGLLVERRRSLKDRPPEKYLSPEPPLSLNSSQKEALEALSAALEEPLARKFLLHGVTASGKTEVYLQAVERCLAGGRGALVLVPEISLTPQMIERFLRRFPGQLAVIHSRLTAAQKLIEWHRVKTSAARVALGARSAVFAPFEKLGLIIIDEEHESSYRQEEAPRYDAREVAWWRARRHQAVLLQGSATPSLESYHEAEQGRSHPLEMPDRIGAAALPPVQVVDMRREIRQGHRHIFSRPLLAALKETLQRKEQAILFINRRGFASFVLCRECGFVVRCPRCAVSLTLHMERGRLVCHYCSYEEQPPVSCPECRGIYIRYFGVGTEKVESELRRLFPAVSQIRMDSDTTAVRGAYDRFYNQFREGRASVLIGTQMIAKGLDFPGVTLVGVITADTALNLPDFRAAERTFQLLAQVSGRAGRGPGDSRVIVQSYHPAHYSIQAAASHDYLSFYRQEIERRRELAYPPLADLLRFLLIGRDEGETRLAAARLFTMLEPLAGAAELLGPAPAPLFRIKSYYRVQIILKGERLAALAPFVKKVVRCYRSHQPPWQARLAVDFNPQVVL